MGMTKVKLTFQEIEGILGRSLPPTARKTKTWWANNKTEKSRQCCAWLEYHWLKEEVDLEKETVIFRKSIEPINLSFEENE
jgi:hypothetical protein